MVAEARKIQQRNDFTPNENSEQREAKRMTTDTNTVSIESAVQ